MNLKSFRIRHYKAIYDSGECELSLENITILAGQNESGKTSVLEALRDFDYPRTINPEAHPDDNDDVKPTIDCTFILSRDDVETLVLGDGKKEYALPKIVKDALLKLGKVTVRKTSPDTYSVLDDEILFALQKIPAPVPQPERPTTEVEQASGEAEENSEESEENSEDTKEASDDQKVPVRTFEEHHEDLATALVRDSPFMIYFDSFDGRLPRKKYLSAISKEDEVGYQAVQDFIKLAGIDVERLTSAADPKQLSNYLESKSATVTGDFLNYWSQKYDGENQVEIVAELNRDDTGPFLNFYVKDRRLRKYPEQRSKGFLWFLSFYLRLNAESRQNVGLGATILIDEPGSYLHPRAQRDILKIFKEIIAGKNNQVVFSTHSSDLIDPEHMNRVRLVLNKKGKGTTIHKLTDSAVRENGATEFADALSPVIAAIGKDLSKDFSVVGKKNVLVEGISDYYYLTTLREKPGFKIPLDIRIIPMTGAPSISHMVSIMIGWGLDYVVVMDRDEQSNAEYKKLVDELDVPSSKIFRIEGGKAIEDLFSDKDFKKFVLDDEGALLPSDKHKSDFIRSQKVVLSRQFCEKYRGATLSMEASTKDNFAKIMQFIKESF